MEFIHIINGLVTLITVILFFKQSRLFFNSRRKHRSLSNAPLLSATAEVGDYVQFHGHLVLTATETPFAKQKCAYWGATVRAEFTTKKPRPAKGMQTHQPVIYKKDRDDLPLLVADDQLTVQLGFTNNIAVVLNYQTKETRSKIPPSAEIAELAKPKYQTYVVRESWLPQDTPMALWGIIDSANKNCITLAGAKDQQESKQQPAFAFHGEASQLLAHFVAKRNQSIEMLIAITILVASLWSWMPQVLHDAVTGVLAIASLVLLLIGHHASQQMPFDGYK